MHRAITIDSILERFPLVNKDFQNAKLQKPDICTIVKVMAITKEDDWNGLHDNGRIHVHLLPAGQWIDGLMFLFEIASGDATFYGVFLIRL